MDAGDLLDHAVDRLGVGDGHEVVERVVGAVALEQVELGARARVAHRDPGHEAVALGLGQRVGALHLDGVLRRHDDEGRLQGVGRAVDRDLALLHRLEQRRLGLGGGAVDLVADDDVGEDRAGPELEAAGVLVEDADAGDVARQQVGRELDAAHRRVDGAGEGLGEHRLADAGHVLDEQVAPGEEHGHRRAHDVGLALDDARHRAGEPIGDLVDEVEVGGLRRRARVEAGLGHGHAVLRWFGCPMSSARPLMAGARPPVIFSHGPAVRKVPLGSDRTSGPLTPLSSTVNVRGAQ